MKRILLVLILFLALGPKGTANALTYNFDAIPEARYDETAFSNLFPGVSFENINSTTKRFIVMPHGTLEPDFAGNVVLNEWYDTPGNSTIAIFDSPTGFVSVTMGQNNGNSSYAIYLEAYDSSNNLITSDSDTIPATSFAGYNLSVSSTSADIAWVKFWGFGYKNNAVYWDNFTFNLNLLTVPVDIHPQNCPNVLDVGAGWLPSAILGT